MSRLNPIYQGKKLGAWLLDLSTVVTKGFPLRLPFLSDANPRILPKSTRIGHPFGICIRASTIFGENCSVAQGVTIGYLNPQEPTRSKTIIGNNVLIGANSLILGNVRVGDNCKIGAGAIVLKDVPPNTTVTGIWK
jgi:serine acetyltransferase